MELKLTINSDLVEKIRTHKTTSIAAFIIKATTEYIEQLEKDMPHMEGENNEKKTLSKNTI